MTEPHAVGLAKEQHFRPFPWLQLLQCCLSSLSPHTSCLRPSVLVAVNSRSNRLSKDYAKPVNHPYQGQLHYGSMEYEVWPSWFLPIFGNEWEWQFPKSVN